MTFPPIFLQSTGFDPSFLIMLGLIFVLFWFMIIRPQRQQMKKHQQMLEALRRGDQVVTSSGLIGKVAKIEDKEILVDLADGVRVRMLRQAVQDVRSKSEPVKAGDKKSEPVKAGEKKTEPVKGDAASDKKSG